MPESREDQFRKNGTIMELTNCQPGGLLTGGISSACSGVLFLLQSGRKGQDQQWVPGKGQMGRMDRTEWVNLRRKEN